MMIKRTKETKRLAIPLPDEDSPASISLEARVYGLDSAFGGLAWARPASVIQETAGRTLVRHIPDITRRRQLTAIALAAMFFLIGLRLK